MKENNVNAFKIIIAMAAVFLLSNCGNSNSTDSSVSAASACASAPVFGSWNNSATGDTLAFGAACTGTSTACGSAFKYFFSSLVDDNYTVNIGSTNGAASCPSANSTTCSYQVSEDRSTMLYDCGGSVLTYQKL